MASIQAPTRVNRSEDVLSFQVNPQPNAFYAVEVATRAELFDRVQHGHERTPDSFYASWQEGPFLSASTYILPEAVWHRLRHTNRLYYRLLTSQSPTDWVNFATTIPDTGAHAAPFVEIIGRILTSPAAAPSITGAVAYSRAAAPPLFQVNPRPNAFYAVEVTTRAELFDRVQHGHERTPDSFYASWQEGPFLSASTYILPEAVWHRLRHANRLYYRLLTSQSPTDWVNFATTSPDTERQRVPFVQIISLFIVDMVDESKERIEKMWTAVQQDDGIRRILSRGRYRVSVHSHMFSPKRPFDPREVELIMVVTREPASTNEQVAIGTMRLDYQTLSVKQSRVFRAPQQPVNAEQAWQTVRSQNWQVDRSQLERRDHVWVLSATRPPPTATGGTAIVEARTGILIYLATTNWQGSGAVSIP